MSPQAASNPNPSQRPRLYVGTACDQCFRIKARCAGERPVCVRCKKCETPCTYSTGHKRKRLSLEEVPQLADLSMDVSCDPPSSAARSTTAHVDVEVDSQGNHRSQFRAMQMAQLPEPVSYSHHVGHTESAEGHLQARSPDDSSPDAISMWAGWLQEPKQTGLDGPLDHADTDKFGPTQLLQSQQCQRSKNQASSATRTVQETSIAVNTDLRDVLTRLQAYVLGVSQDTPGVILEELQRSLFTVCAYLNSIEAIEASMSVLETGWGADWPPNVASQCNPVVAVTYARAIELIFFCYLKIRHQHIPLCKTSKSTGSVSPTAPGENSSAGEVVEGGQRSAALALGQSILGHPASSVFDTLLDQYIARDMRLCQSLAQRLISWCSKIAGSTQAATPKDGTQVNDTASAMDITIDSMKACTLVAL